MFIIEDYSLAVIFCIITMFCWGSWGNTQKLAGKTWRYELFYWDYVIGILLLSLIFAFTLGSNGTAGRPFLEDLAQAQTSSIISAFIGGIVFNAANILLSTAIAIAGMSVAFPVGIGIALVLGVIINYLGSEKGNAGLLFAGVAMITVAIIINAIAYKRASSGEQKVSSKGLVVSIIAGVLMSFFYRFIASAMDLDNFADPAAGLMTPYTAVVVFSLGIFVSNFIFNTILFKRPISGEPTSYSAYFAGSFSTHLVGIFGGLIWGVGNSFNLIAAGKAGAAVSYGLGQGATLVAALWGVFVWKEFKNTKNGAMSAGRQVSGLLAVMFVLFLVGIISIIYAGQ
jgi:glucose uptake protein